ncbi:OmpA family protein [Vibrio plantisponsor]|uniref:OmpA family protein n=2 Tax=Vibrio plantisponsor TaxID=664643 RepID=A0ABU4IFI7_9VIBR|nr:OmpA family protein [Vibrio plantisponsor]MDW6017241.1 OmpA family protein [Vibrio plantisponsor]
MDQGSGVLNMKKNILSLAILASLTLSTSVYSAEEYEYMATPTANQIADLQDDDQDGVVNGRDICPGTPSGSEVDNDGCGEVRRAQDQRQLRILFANDSYEINPVFASQIQTMADFLKIYKSASIEIQGYTSKVGTDEYNLELSKKRAEAVEKKLLSYDISSDRVRIVGYGESRLEDQGDDPAAHAVNRKVTATVVGLTEKVVEEWTIFSTLQKR